MYNKTGMYEKGLKNGSSYSLVYSVYGLFVSVNAHDGT
jgi:hypothetical protein